MAPRRTRKVGLRRIDAAFDALRPMGFSHSLVRKTINNLLKVYGNNGWSFLEENSYQLVMDTMLEEQKNSEEKKVAENCFQKTGNVEDEHGTQPDPSQFHYPQDDNMEEEHGTQPCSSRVHSLQDYKMEGEPGKQPSSSLVHSPQNDNMEDGFSPIRTLQNHSTPVRSALITRPPPETDIIPCSSKDETTSQDLTERQFPSPQLFSAGAPLLMQSPSPVNSHQIWNRKPSYGWISSDDEDDEEDLVHLKPAIGGSN